MTDTEPHPINWGQPCPPERRCTDRHNLCPAACHEAAVMSGCSCSGGPHGGYTCEACR